MERSEPKRNVAAIEPEVLMKKNRSRNEDMTVPQRRDEIVSAPAAGESRAGLLRELVALLRQNRTQLPEEWPRRITPARFLTPITKNQLSSHPTPLSPHSIKL